MVVHSLLTTLTPMWSSVHLIPRHKLTPDTIEVAILPRRGRIEFNPGQFIVLEKTLGDDTRRSAFSIVRKEGKGIVIAVHQNGTAGISAWLNALNQKSTAQLAGPFGDFSLIQGVDKHVFIAGGSGITPVRCILDDLLAASVVPTLIYSNRDPNKVIFGESLRMLHKAGLLNLVEVFDRDLQTALDHTDGEGTAFYACGSSSLVNSALKILENKGIPKDRICIEKYGLDMVGGSTPSDSFEWKAPFKKPVNIAHQSGKSILQSALQSGVQIPHACEVGVCGACAVRIQTGQVICGKEIKRDGDEILACISNPIGRSIPILKPKRKNRSEIVSLALVIGAIFMGIWSIPPGLGLRAKGPMNTSHERLQCESCHKEAPGTLRQQLGHNSQAFLGLHDISPVAVGYKEVDNKVCMECHDRPDDLHPVSRFMEPQFAEQRATLKAHECNGCHGEHQGKRVANVGIAMCKSCHSDMEVAYDQVQPTHAQLLEDDAWETCMSCHDFHGNHLTEIPTRLEKGIPTEALLDYLDGGPDPYSVAKKHTAKEAR